MAKSKQSILFLHGALGTAQDLTDLMGIFIEKGYDTHSFTFSGHGKNASDPREFRIDLFARDLENYLQSTGLKDVVIFGYSMGGYVALYHNINFENTSVRSIFTYGTKFNWSPSAVSIELSLMDPDNLQEKFPQFATDLNEKHGERWKQLLRSTAHMMQNLERLDGLMKEDFMDVSIPVYLILGDQDRMVTSEETQLVASWIHHAKVHFLSHSKHELEKANLKEIARIIEKNLD